MFSSFFIKRPILSAVISIVLVILGMLAFFKLPISQYPDILPPSVVISANYPGANSLDVARDVARPIEEEVNGVENMLYLSSVCSNNGEYRLTITFKVGTDLDQAMVQVQNRLSKAEPFLPQEVRKLGLELRKQTTNILMFISLFSEDKGLDELFLSNYAVLHLKNELKRLPGVGDVQVFGAGEYSLRVWLNPEKIQELNLTIPEVIQAIESQNVQVGAGSIGNPPAPAGQQFQLPLQVKGRLSELEEFSQIVIKKWPDGRLIRLKDVANLELGAVTYSISSQYKGIPAAAIAIFQSPSANALQVATLVEQKMKELAQKFPPGLKYTIPFDSTRFVNAAFEEVLFTFISAFLLVFLTMILFLEDWRAALIPGIAIPVSLIASFLVLHLLGFSLNLISLFGLVLAIGIVVDDAIVVVENVVRHIEENQLTPQEASLRAMQEVTGPVIGTTLVLLSVFVPTVFLEGISGQLFTQFGLTISVATVFSSINALTLSPALCAVFLRPKGKKNWFFRLFDQGFVKVRNGYLRVLVLFLRKSVLGGIFFLLLLFGAYKGFVSLPTGFLPQEDQGYVMLAIQLPNGASKQRTQEVVDKINKSLQKEPALSGFVSVTGYSLLDGAPASNSAAMWLILKPWEERKSPELGLQAVITRLWQLAYQVEEANVFAFPPPAIIGIGGVGGFQLELQQEGELKPLELEDTVYKVLAGLNQKPSIASIFTSYQAKDPQVFINLDRLKANSLGVNIDDVFTTLSVVFGSAYVNDFNKFGKNYQIRVAGNPTSRDKLEDILGLKVLNQEGKRVPLGSLVRLQKTVGPKLVHRYNLKTAATLSGNLKPGFSTGIVLKEIGSFLEENLPLGYSYEWTGMSYQEQATQGQAGKIFLLATFFAYLILCALYESWTLPLAVMLSVPFAFVGLIGIYFLLGLDVNLYTQLGLILLIGLTSKTAILIAEFAKVLVEEQNLSPFEAACEAAKLRFRPILMTAFTFILGVVPLLLSSGAGATSRFYLGTAVIAGMFSGIFLMLFFTPLFFIWLSKKS